QRTDTLSCLALQTENAMAAVMVWWNNLQLKSRNPEARRKAIEALKPPGDERTLEILVAALADDDGEVRGAAARAFEQIKHPNAGPALIAAVRQGSPDLRQAAVTALGHLGDVSPTRLLADLLKHSNPAMRAAAAGALRRLAWKPSTREEQALFEIALGNTRAAAFAGEAALQPLVTELKHDTSFQRRAAAEALANVNDPRRIQPLLAAARDPDATVRVSAIHALGKEN